MIQKVSSGQTFTDILNLCCDLDLKHSYPIFPQHTLTLNTVILFFHSTLWFIMLYYQIKFGCKLTSSLEDTTAIAIFWLYKPSLWPWHWTPQTNFSAWPFWLMMLHKPYQVWRQNVPWFRGYHPDKQSLTFLTYAVTLTLNAAIPFFHKTLWLMMPYYQTEFGCKRTNNLKDIVGIVTFWLYKYKP